MFKIVIIFIILLTLDSGSIGKPEYLLHHILSKL
jgi:hypothetical protein